MENEKIRQIKKAAGITAKVLNVLKIIAIVVIVLSIVSGIAATKATNGRSRRENFPSAALRCTAWSCTEAGTDT